MQYFNDIKKPSKEEQKTAMESHRALAVTLHQLQSEYPEIEIEETKEKIKIPLSAFKLFGEILEAMSKGMSISIVPIATEVTTQSAAKYLGCSQPQLVKLLDEGKIPLSTFKGLMSR